jgi:ATP-binding cassette subfamily G (WHITE) protein 2 (SNQ2)
MFERRTFSGKREETSSNIAPRALSQPTHLDLDLCQASEPAKADPPPLPLLHRRPSISRLSIGLFNPEGVDELRRRLTQQSNGQARDEHRGPDSDATLWEKLEEQPFDLAKALRGIVQKCVKARQLHPIDLSAISREDDHEISRRELGIVFKNLRVVGLGATTSYAPTLGSLFSPFSMIEEIQKLIHPPVRDILSGFEGVVRPGEMTCRSLSHISVTIASAV